MLLKVSHSSNTIHQFSSQSRSASPDMDRSLQLEVIIPPRLPHHQGQDQEQCEPRTTSTRYCRRESTKTVANCGSSTSRRLRPPVSMWSISKMNLIRNCKSVKQERPESVPSVRNCTHRHSTNWFAKLRSTVPREGSCWSAFATKSKWQCRRTRLFTNHRSLTACARLCKLSNVKLNR